MLKIFEMLMNQKGQIPIPAQPKKPVQLPFGQPNQPLPLVNQAPQVGAISAVPAPQVKQPELQQQVLETGQKKAISGFESPVLDLTQQRTQELLQAPTIGPSPEVAAQRAGEQFAFQSAQQQEALRQRLGGQLDIGTTRGDLSQLALSEARLKTDVERQTEAEQASLQRQQLLGSIEEGRRTSEAGRLRFGTDIGALAQISAAAEPGAQREFQAAENAIDRGMTIALANQNAALETGLIELQGKIQQGLLLTEQDFAGTQAELDRELQKAIQNNDINAQIEITRMQQEFTAQEREADQTFRRAERISTQGWKSDERLSDQDFAIARQLNDQKFQEALQSNDFLQQRIMFAAQSKLDLKMQTNEMEFSEKQLFLQDQLATARANGDVDRQKSIIQFQTGQDLTRIRETHGFQEAQAALDRRLEESLQAEDHVQTRVLQQFQFDFAAEKFV